jgi:histone H3/H4
MPASDTVASKGTNVPPTPPPVSKAIKRKPRRQFSIPKIAFRRLVAEIAYECNSDVRFRPDALEMLQETSERLVSDHFAKSKKVAEICKLDTIRKEHWNFAFDQPA